MHNTVILTGRLTTEPELRQTPSQKFVCHFQLAVQRKYNKNAKQDTDFIPIEAWDNDANFVAKHFSKGDLIDIVGQLSTSRWTDDDGKKRSKTFVITTSISFAPTNNRKAAEKNNTNPFVPPSELDLSDFEEITDNDLPY